MKIAPSILSADFANLERDIKRIELGGADYVHVDVMDGHFVPNLSIGAPVVKAIRRVTDMPLDVHLMIQKPDSYLDDFINAGSDIITVHYESDGDTLAQVKKIKAAGIRAGVSIKPATPAEVLLPLLPILDIALVMTVEPGFGGQSYIEACSDKIRFLRKAIDDGAYKCELEMDGGAGEGNIAHIAMCGADVAVAGSAVYGKADVAAAIANLKALSEN